MLFDTLKKKAAAFPWKGVVVLAAGILLVGWLLETPAGLLGKADAIGYAVCHRIDLRSFHIDGQSMPLCARCSGMYLGAMLGLAFLSLTRPRRGGLPGMVPKIVLGIFVLGFVFDGLNSFLSLVPGAPLAYTPQNWSRLVTGTGMGLAIAAFLFPAFNQTVWRDWNAWPVLDGWKSMAVLVLLAAGLDVLVLVQNPYILYPLALISAAGVLVILTMIYSMLWLMILHKENRYDKIRQLGFIFLAGFTIALFQIALFDAIRFGLTGTWDGFHLG